MGYSLCLMVLTLNTVTSGRRHCVPTLSRFTRLGIFEFKSVLANTKKPEHHSGFFVEIVSICTISALEFTH